MFRRVVSLTVVAAFGALLGGCALSIFDFDRREAWRETEEQACLVRRPASPYIAQVREIDGKGACGVTYPLSVSALESGTIGVGPGAVLGCPMTEALEIWMRYSVQPAALAWFGMPLISIKQISAYYCRTRDSIPGAELSEHAFGNALDIAAFTLANGHEIVVQTAWRDGTPEEQGFLQEIFASACRTFKTVLGPGSDKYHYNHIHLDLAHHNRDGTSRYCKPTPTVVPPARPPFNGALYAAIPGQPRYASVPAYTGSIVASQASPIDTLLIKEGFVGD